MLVILCYGTTRADGLDGVPRDVPRSGDGGWNEDELRQLARTWAEESGPAEPAG